jgi:microsomal dipeptidase-like Zn-dependent dipeptidase
MKGCSGDCFCNTGRGHGVPLGWKSEHSCVKMENIPEPGLAWKAPATKPANPMRGYADLHVHLFGHMAHGGGVLAGKPYDAEEGINGALRPDHGRRKEMVGIDGKRLAPSVCPEGLKCGRNIFHGDHAGADSALFDGTKDGANGNLGAPSFSGWPRWSSTVHQQVYYKWLERAWRGGLRIMSMLAVTNEAACRASRRLKKCDKKNSACNCARSMDLIDDQLDEAWKFQKFIDDQHGGPGKGWFRIVTSPSQARSVIRSGQLAVVLGIEVDNLFGCKENTNGKAWKGAECTKATIAAEVAKYYQKGVRHVFPIHNFDNAFGGAAAWQDVINFGNGVVEGRFWEQRNCYDDGYGFWLDSVGLANFRGGFPTGTPVPPVYPHYEKGNGNVWRHASCNTRGLTNLGEALIHALIDKGIVIDVDHMSRKSLVQTLGIAAKRKAPVVASHVLFFDRHKQKFEGNGGRHERMRTTAQLHDMRKLGALLGVMLKDDVQDGDRKGQQHTVAFHKTKVSDACRHSTRTFAHSLLFGIDTMKGPVALGSDFNGMAGHIGPRFGSDACGGDPVERARQLQENQRLQYPFTLDGFGTFDRQVTGHKTFDFNVDGLAHVGLMPDMLADLLAIGVKKEELEPVFRSAEAYVELWERAAKAAKPSKPGLVKGPKKAK